MHEISLGSWPARRAQRSPDKVAFVYEGHPTTFGRFDSSVDRLAARLRAAGVSPGDRVAYLGPNHPAFVETMFATLALGGVFVPLNFRLAAPELTYMLGDSGTSVLVHAASHTAVVGGITEFTGVRATVTYADGVVDYEGLPPPATSHNASVPDRSRPALILYTSGTTGRPKGAVLTHDNIIWNCLNLLVDVDVAADEITLVSAPLFHVAALNQTLLPTFLKGGTSVIMPSWDVEGCLDLIERYGVTWMFGVTAMFAGLLHSPRWSQADLSSVRTLMSGGAPVPEGLIRRYQERGLVFCQGYGMTETAPGATFLSRDRSIAKVGSAGVPCFFTDVRVVDGALRDVAPGETGEVLVRGPNVTPGYWGRPDATESAMAPDGWFRTGDLASLDHDGYLTIVDRVKDMYISGGENVYPAEVEAVLFEHGDVVEAAVIGVPDERWGEVGAAFVVTAAGATVDAAQLSAFLEGRLAKYKVPVHIRLVDHLPRTSSGKTRKPDLREWWHQG